MNQRRSGDHNPCRLHSNKSDDTTPTSWSEQIDIQRPIDFLDTSSLNNEQLPDFEASQIVSPWNPIWLPTFAPLTWTSQPPTSRSRNHTVRLSLIRFATFQQLLPYPRCQATSLIWNLIVCKLTLTPSRSSCLQAILDGRMGGWAAQLNTVNQLIYRTNLSLRICRVDGFRIKGIDDF